MRVEGIVGGIVLALAVVQPRHLGAQSCGPEELGPRAECGRITVFEDRARESGRKIEVHYVVLRAEQPVGKEPVFMFAGGPGGASRELADLVNGPYQGVRKQRDVVLVDQRGSGLSNPLICPTAAAEHPQVAFGHVFDPAVMRGCRSTLETHADLNLYTTEIAVLDIDEIRARLGYGRVIVWGASYGSRLAQAYARRYPANTIAVVLDGVVSFDFHAPATYARSLQTAVERVFADCRAWRACRDSFPSVEGDFAALLAKVQAGPVSARVARSAGDSGVEVRLSAGDFGYAVRGIMYSSRGARALPGLIHRAARTGDLSGFAQRYWERVVNFGTFADGLHFSIFCAEDVPFIADGEIAGLTAGTFLGSYLLDEYRDGCRDWVRAPVGPRIQEPLSGDVPVLLVSGWFDPVTPASYAERVAATLPRSRHILVRNEAHGSTFGCARPAVIHALTEGTLEGLPSVCDGVTNLWSR
ncbi:MAG: alpha/beta fold hydrolase [Gemmatimonadales bacterium]